MADSAITPELAAVVDAEFCRYFEHLAARVEHAARSVPREQFWVRPFAYGNSIGHLVLHLTGNLNHYVGSAIAGTGYVRDRPREFTDPDEAPADDVLARFQAAVAMVVTTIRTLDAESLTAAVVKEPPVETRFGLLLVCASHLNNHIGQMSYLVQALGHGTLAPPRW